MKWLLLGILLIVSIGELSAQKALITVHYGDSTYIKNEIVHGFSSNLLHGKFRTYDLTQVKHVQFYENLSVDVQTYLDSRNISYNVLEEFEGGLGYFLFADSVYFDPND